MKCSQERSPAAGMLREVPQRVVEGDEDRQLDEHRQARGSRVDLVLPVELHQLFVLLLLVLLVLLLDLLHLRRIALQVLHRVDLLHRQRHEQHPDDHGQRDDRPRPREADGAVQPVEDGAARDARAASAGSRRGGRADASSGSPRRSRIEAAVAPRVAAQERAIRRARHPERGLLPAAPRRRTASTTGGTCTSSGRARRT